jgi:histidinol-phosphate/aromatic aminotransferase/cobyric acid decarboxylase-like protein
MAPWSSASKHAAASGSLVESVLDTGHLSRLAEADLDEMWLRLAVDSLEQADRLVARLQHACQMLAANPAATTAGC